MGTFLGTRVQLGEFQGQHLARYHVGLRREQADWYHIKSGVRQAPRLGGTTTQREPASTLCPPRQAFGSAGNECILVAWRIPKT